MFVCISLLYITSTFLIFVEAVNDWSKPCFQGRCAYDVAASGSSMGGSLTITGSSTAISDITDAAGWQILDCDANTSSQNIILICQSGDTTSTGCGHLFEGGAVGTIVRLPENCGKSPFARVYDAWIPSNQSTSSSVSSGHARRDGISQQPQVQALSIDTNFTNIDPSEKGSISIYIQGSTNPTLGGNVATVPSSSRRRANTPTRRSLKSFVDQAVDALSNINSFNQSLDTSVQQINVDKNFPLFNTSIDCGESQASIDMNVDVSLYAQIELGVVVAGTLVPPKFSEFAIYSGMTADLEGTLNLDARAADNVGLGTITLFQIGIPGLDIPDIITIGPSFKIDAKANVDIDTELQTSIGLNYNVEKLQLVFPPSSSSQSYGDADPEDSSFSLSIDPDISTNITLEVHLIPTLDLGIDALDGEASATVFLDLDASAALEFGLDSNNEIGIADTSYAMRPSDSNQINACVDLKSGISINAGAQGSFFDLFDAQTQVPIFSKEFVLFQKCFGSSNPSYTSKKKRRIGRLMRREATCLDAGFGDLVSLVDSTLDSSTFKTS